MSEPPYSRVVVALALLLLLSLAVASLYIFVLRPHGLPFPWQ